MRWVDLLLSGKASAALALGLLVLVALQARSAGATSDGPHLVLGGAAMVLLLIYGLRLVARIRRLWRPAMPASAPLRWSDQPRFDPVRADPASLTGYFGYTDSFSATMTVHRYLAALPDEEARIAACGFACAYLRERMALAPRPSLVGEERRSPARTLAAESMLGWLAGIHRDYPDNAPADSEFVERALHEAATEYGDGRSLALQRGWMSLATDTLLAGLGESDRQRRLEAQKALTDLDRDAARSLLRWGGDYGRELAGRHGAIAEPIS